jgi:Arylsulfotransferase (ASST)
VLQLPTTSTEAAMRRLSSFSRRSVLRRLMPTGRPSFGRVAGTLSIAGLATICFLAGAAVLHFQLPLSSGLTTAFEASEDWLDGANSSDRTGAHGDLPPAAHRPADAFNGFTLYTTARDTEATLIDMGGTVVHRWKMPAGITWPHAKGVKAPHANDVVHWERCHLYPNGDLLALCSRGNNSPYGYGLAKLDKDSKLLWLFSANLHHDFDVDEDGRILTLLYRLNARPPADLDGLPSSFTDDQILVLSPDGKQLDTIPLLEAFRDSPYFLTLLSGIDPDPANAPPLLPGQQSAAAGLQPGLPQPGLPQPGIPDFAHGPNEPTAPFPPPGLLLPPPRLSGPEPGDVFHTNSVKVLRRDLASKFPAFKAGQLLISLRSSSAIAVVDLQTRSVVWAAKGVWQYQHDAQFLDDGRLLLFDNGGGKQGSRTIEYDPITQAVPWYYQGDKAKPFFVPFRGGNQRLPNGNTLIVDSAGARLLEVTRSKDVVWEWGCPPASRDARTNSGPPVDLTGARRYGPDELPFLKNTREARPK